MLENMRKRTPRGFVPVLFAVYASKAEPGTWKGFAAPFGISTQAPTDAEARRKLEELADLYIEGLREKGFPKHLMEQRLTDPEDQSVLDQIMGELAEEMAQANPWFWK